MNSIIALLFLLFSSSLLAQEKTLETNIEQSQGVQQRYLGLNIGGSYGNNGLGITLGKRLNDKNILEANYKSWSGREVTGVRFSGPAKVVYNGYGIGASNKYFFYNSFNLKAGAFYRKSILDVPPGLILFQNGKAISEREISDISGEISLGNHWFGKRWNFAIDWIGYVPTIIKLNEIAGFRDSNFQVLNLTLGYSF